MLALTKTTLEALRAALLRDGVAGATALQDAGYAGGEALYDAFGQWLAARGESSAADLPLDEFAREASEFFHENGWGTVNIGALNDSIATIDSADWPEADESANLAHPGCHLTTGMLAGFFGGAGGAPLAALEVECRSAGDARCRFVLGAGPVLLRIYEAMESGTSYQEAAASLNGR
jgi:predicted hydrocarbon binding protein